MKRSIFIKILALALSACMLTAILASCAMETYFISGKTALMSMSGTSESGKAFEVTITANEFKYYLTNSKIEVLAYYEQNGFWQIVDNTYNKVTVNRTHQSALWNSKTTDKDGNEITYNENYTNSIIENCRQVLIEKYLFAYYDLEFTEEENAALKTQKETFEAYAKQLGGKGAYKQYFGATISVMLQVYKNDLIRERLYDYLYGDENPRLPLTDEQKNDYYNENYGDAQFIFIDYGANKVYFDEEKTLPIFTDADSKKVYIDPQTQEHVLLVETTKYYQYEYYDEYGTKVSDEDYGAMTDEQKAQLEKRPAAEPFDTTLEENKDVNVSDTAKFKKVVTYEVSKTYENLQGEEITDLEGLVEGTDYTVKINHSDAKITGFLVEAISSDDEGAEAEKTLLGENLYEKVKEILGADKDKTPKEDEEENDDDNDTETTDDNATTAAQSDVVPVTIEQLIIENTDNYDSYKYANGYLFKYTDDSGNTVNPFDSDDSVLTAFKDLEAGEYRYIEVSGEGAYIIIRKELPEKEYEKKYITEEDYDALLNENESRKSSDKEERDLSVYTVDDYYAGIFSSSVNATATEEDDVFTNGFENYVKANAYVELIEKTTEEKVADNTYKTSSKLAKFQIKDAGLPNYYDFYIQQLQSQS